MKRPLLFGFSVVLFAISMLANSGCAHRDPADSNIPWGRPAAWEDRVPGMGDF